MRDDIVGDSFFGHHQNRRLPEIADLNAAFGAPDFRANVIAKNSIAAQMNHADSSVVKIHIDDRIIDIAQRLQFGIG